MLKVGIRALLAGVVSSALLVSAAQSATWTVDQQSAGSIYEDAGGNNAWQDSVNATFTGEGTFDTGAGLFRLTADDGDTVQNFIAFCVELTQFINLPDVYTDTLGFSSTILDRINALVTNALSLVNNSSTAAAFQLSLWEIISDAVLDLDGGNFQVNSTGIAATETTADTWLANISSAVWVSSPATNFSLIESPDSQNLLAIGLTTPTTDVPLPAPGLMLFAALLGLVGLRRVPRAV